MNSSKNRAGIARGDTDAGAAPEERLRRRDVLKALGAAAAVASLPRLSGGLHELRFAVTDGIYETELFWSLSFE